MSRLCTTHGQRTECEDRARILETEFAINSCNSSKKTLVTAFGGCFQRLIMNSCIIPVLVGKTIECIFFTNQKFIAWTSCNSTGHGFSCHLPVPSLLHLLADQSTHLQDLMEWTITTFLPVIFLHCTVIVFWQK